MARGDDIILQILIEFGFFGPTVRKYYHIFVWTFIILAFGGLFLLYIASKLPASPPTEESLKS
jgi:hypothetical protein